MFEKIATHFDPVELEEIRKIDEDQQGGRNSDIPFQHCPFSRYHACTVSLFRLPYPDRYSSQFLIPFACAREINGSAQNKTMARKDEETGVRKKKRELKGCGERSYRQRGRAFVGSWTKKGLEGLLSTKGQDERIRK